MRLNHQGNYLLVSAHHCAPHMGSEHAVGWNYIKGLCKNNNIIVVTEDNDFKDKILQEINDVKNIDFDIQVFFVKHGQKSDGRKNNLRLGYYLSYILYQLRVYKKAKELMSIYSITSIHHLTIVGFREPGFLWLYDVPFIWGPVGGLVYSPRKLFSTLSFKMKVFQSIRNIITSIQFNYSPRVRLAYRKTQKNGCFIAAEPSIGRMFKNKFGGNYTWIPETGAGEVYNYQKEVNRTDELHILWVGALIDIKPLGLLLESLNRIKCRKIKLTVVGDGDAKCKHEEFVKKNSINAVFAGWVNHNDIHKYYSEADLFCLLSLKDLTTNVVFEALSHSLPVICLNHHGYSYIVDESCGYKIEIKSREQVISKLASTLVDINNDRAQLVKKSIHAKNKAREYSWDNNVEKLNSIYDGLLK